MTIIDSLSGVPQLQDSSSSESDSWSEERSRELSSNSSNNSHDECDNDPYSDVRERMEALVYEDRQKSNYTLCVGSIYVYATMYWMWVMALFLGVVRDFTSRIFGIGRFANEIKRDRDPDYAPLSTLFENFYYRRVYVRVIDAFNRPIATNPGASIDVLERVSYDSQKTMEILNSTEELPERLAKSYDTERHRMLDSGLVRRCINLGSYNYLGFADDWSTTCQDDVLASLDDLPVNISSSRSEVGTTTLHIKLEQMIAEFLGKPNAIVFNMGFNTNTTSIPALVQRGDLIISDELNHTSLVNGARASGAHIRTFKHNDAKHLEHVIRDSIVIGQPRSRRPFRKILVIVEGIYSMEGFYCDLGPLSKVCKKYGAYLYLDEAHSIGATGPTGRGICELCNVSPNDVHILMGTFSKSFGGMGGYIASSHEVIQHLKSCCASLQYHVSLSPIVCQQIITALRIIQNPDCRKIRSLRDNSNYFRMRLIDMGAHVLGNYDSPVIPVMVYLPSKLPALSRECFKRGIAVVVVSFPAVSLQTPRARICVSASHTREDIDKVLQELQEVLRILHIDFNNHIF